MCRLIGYVMAMLLPLCSLAQNIIPATGRVGIGTTSPIALCEINGDTVVRGGLEAGEVFDFHLSSKPVETSDFGFRLHHSAPNELSMVSASGYARLTVYGSVSCNTLQITSDFAQKSGFSPVDDRAVLAKVCAMPISQWHYTNAPTVKHIGPMAQAFKAAFDLGDSDKEIPVGDGIGVGLASIQALNSIIVEESRAKDRQIASLRAQVAAMQAEQAEIIRRLAAVEASRTVQQASLRK